MCSCSCSCLSSCSLLHGFAPFAGPIIVLPSRQQQPGAPRSNVSSRMAGVPIEASGLDFQLLGELLSARVAQCVYLIPTFHNPTGNTLTDLQRRQLVKMTQGVNVPLIEDLTLANNVLEREPPPPLATYAQEGAVITIGSLSKIFWAGLRVGWIRGTVPLIERLARLKAVSDLGSSMISQLIAIRLLPQLEQVKYLRQQELTPRRDLLLELLQSRVSSWSWQRPKGGLFVWVQLPEGDIRELAQEALQEGVIVIPGTTLSVDGTHTSWFRLPFFLIPDRLQGGLELCWLLSISVPKMSANDGSTNSFSSPTSDQPHDDKVSCVQDSRIQFPTLLSITEAQKERVRR